MSDAHNKRTMREIGEKIAALEAGLREAIEAIEQAPEDAFGYAALDLGELGQQRYPLKEELLAKLRRLRDE